MGAGDYICLTLHGGAPWGFNLKEGQGDTYTPFLVSQVEEDGRALLAGLQDGDEVVSINGEPCAELTLLRAFALIDTSTDCLQLLVKRYHSIPAEDSESEGERASSGEPVESTTLHIFSQKHSAKFPRDLYISESQDEAPFGELDCSTEYHKEPELLWTRLHAPSPSDDQSGREKFLKKNNNEVQRCFSPGDMVELQVSLSEQTLDDVGCTSLGSAHGIEGGLSNREAVETFHTTTTITTSHYVPSSVREPLGQHGVVVSSPSMLGQVEVILQQPAASGSGRSIASVGGPRVSESVGSQSEGDERGEHCEGVPGSFTVSFEIPSEEGAAAEEQGSDSEDNQDKPNKHRARHARLRRSESQSEKQVKEAKSKCKRIALLLTAAPSNPNNKGVLMFKKHRQRAKKYTLVSYGTGEDEPEYSDEEDDESGDDKQEIPTVEFTLVAHNDSEIDKHFLTDANSDKGLLTLNWDRGLLEIERNLNNQAKMECLPDTQGKGALMFAQRRLRMDEISAEHDELRRQGIPVESVQVVEKKVVEQSFIQPASEGHAYMDVNMHQQSQQHYQQYQEQQYYEQQQNYQQQQQYQQQQYHHQQQQQQQLYEQRQYQQQQTYQQQQEYQEQHQMQNYSTSVNGTVQHQMNEMQSSFGNRTAKPFSAGNMVPTPYTHAESGATQESVGQGEQIASRDERISTPAIKTGFLMDARKRSTGKPMFTFKDAPKVSPNPALLNLLNKGDKKPGFESGPEEDYLSLGAEACNFLQSPRGKHKTPPPVAPKPVINPNCPPWSPQLETSNQDTPQYTENSMSTPAVAPTTENIPAPELEPTPAPAPEPSPPPAPQETAVCAATAEQPTWVPPEPESHQQPLQVTAQEASDHRSSTLQVESSHVSSWGAAQTQVQQSVSASWQQTQVQPQEPPPSQSPPQPPWVTRQSPQTQPQVQQPTNTWNPQMQPTWAQPQEQPQPQPQVQSSWAQPNEQQHLQQMQPTWGQPQEPMHQQPQNQWTQQSQMGSQQQPPWMQQSQKKTEVQPPWVQQAQPEPQPQPQWVQHPQHPAQQQQPWPQAQAPGQPLPPWVSAQPQQQQQQQPSMNAWAPSQPHPQGQPPWIQEPQPHTQSQANLNPWAPVPPQAQPQPQWAPHPSEQGQHSWAQQQNQGQSQQPWTQGGPPQPTPQPNWQQPTSNAPQQAPMNTWSSAQTQPAPPANAWTPQSPQQTPVTSVSTPTIQPSPKPWHAPENPPQSRIPPPPPQRSHSFTVTQRTSSPINPMATILNPPSSGSAFEMPVVRGKGADMFAKRQSRMEKFVVDSETVEANKAGRPTSPAASMPTEWKYTPNVRAPPPRAYNPIQSPSYPPGATKQPPSNSPSTKSKKTDKEKQKPAPKPLNVIDVMKHQPYQLSSSLFIFGPEPEKPPTPKPSPQPNPPCESQPIQYEQMAPVPQAQPFSAPYPQQGYGMPMQPMMHDGQYQLNQANMYPPPNPYQQPLSGPYQQPYNQQYQQPAPPVYHPQSPQSPNAPYQNPQALQAAYQPANSPPYLATPSAPYHPQLSSSYVAPTFPVAARPDSASGSNAVASAPKPKFTAKKSSAQAIGRSYSLSPPARVPFSGQKSASASSSPRPPALASRRQTAWPEKACKPLTPWEAASRHPLGLVDEAFAFQSLQQNLASNVHLAAQRKMLPKPPTEWKARVSYQAPQKTGSQTWSPSQSRSQSRAPIPSFLPPTRSPVSSHAGYNSLPRQWQAQKPNLGPSLSPSECRRPPGTQTYKSVYTSNTWSWRR